MICDRVSGSRVPRGAILGTDAGMNPQSKGEYANVKAGSVSGCLQHRNAIFGEYYRPQIGLYPAIRADSR